MNAGETTGRYTALREARLCCVPIVDAANLPSSNNPADHAVRRSPGDAANAGAPTMAAICSAVSVRHNPIAASTAHRRARSFGTHIASIACSGLTRASARRIRPTPASSRRATRAREVHDTCEPPVHNPNQ